MVNEKDFDPYHRWLGIRPEEQPADHYRLLGLAPFENDPEVIQDAAERYIRHVRSYDRGEHRELAKRILNELARAKAVLLDPTKRTEYDRQLPGRMPAQDDQPDGQPHPPDSARPPEPKPVERPVTAPAEPVARIVVSDEPRRSRRHLHRRPSKPGQKSSPRGGRESSRVWLYYLAGGLAILLVGAAVGLGWLVKATNTTNASVDGSEPPTLPARENPSFAGRTTPPDPASTGDGLEAESGTTTPPPAVSPDPPERLGMKLLCTCRGHEQGLRSVTFLPEGERMLSGSNDDTLRLWDLTSGDKIHCFRGHANNVTDMEFLDNGRRAISSSDDRSMILWDLVARKQIRGMPGHRGSVISLAVSPLGQHAAASGHDREARIWDIQAGKQVRQLRRHTWSVEDVAWSPDGRYILTGGGDHRLCCWDAESGEHLWEQKPGYNWIRLRFSRDSKYAFSYKKRYLDVWNPADGQKIRRFDAGDTGIATVEFIPSQNQVLAATGSGLLIVWNLDSGEEYARRQIEGKFVRQVVADRDGFLIASVGEDHAIEVWRITVQPPLPTDAATYAR